MIRESQVRIVATIDVREILYLVVAVDEKIKSGMWEDLEMSGGDVQGHIWQIAVTREGRFIRNSKAPLCIVKIEYSEMARVDLYRWGTLTAIVTVDLETWMAATGSSAERKLNAVVVTRSGTAVKQPTQVTATD